jgi:WD40 repeat protein
MGAPAITAEPARQEPVPRLGRVTCLDFAGGLLAAAGDRVCCVWNTVTHALHCRIVTTASIDAVCLLRDRGAIAVVEGRHVSVYDLASGQSRFAYEHDVPITSVHGGIPAATMASADAMGLVQVRDTADGRLIRTLAHPPGRPIVYVADDQHVLVESHMHCTLVDIASGESVRRFPFARDENVPFTDVRFASTLVSHTAGVLRWFDCATCEGAHCTRDLGSEILSIDICNERGLVLAALADGRMCLFDLTSGEPRGVLGSLTSPLMFAKFGEDASVYAAAGEPLVMHLVDGRHRRSYYDAASPLVAMALHAERRALLVSDRDGGVAHFSLRDGSRQDRLGGHSGSVSAVACCDEWVASGAYDGRLLVRDWEGRTVLDADLQEGPLQAIALDPAVRRVWAGTWAGRVSCFDLDTCERISSIACGAASIRTLCIDPRRRRILAGDEEGQIRFLDLTGTRAALQGMRQPGAVYRGMFAPNGDVLTSAKDGVRRSADCATEPYRLYPCSDARWFELTQQELYALSLSGELKVFDADSGELLASTRVGGHGPHRSVALLDADRIFTASADGFVRVFDTRLEPIATLEVLRCGFAWRAARDHRHPGWLFTDRDDLAALRSVECDLEDRRNVSVS